MIKNLFENEEQVLKLSDDILTELKEDKDFISHQLKGDDLISFNTGFHKGFIAALKQAGAIRKSPLEEAREKTDEYVNKTCWLVRPNELVDKKGHLEVSETTDKLIQLIQSERQIVDAMIKEKE